MTQLIVHRAGPSLSLQDFGRPGLLSQGVSIGGAADRMALHEASALLGLECLPAIEMAGFGGLFAVEGGGVTFALTGAPMRARLNDEAIIWNASHRLEPGDVLDIGPAMQGTYGYLAIAGGLDAPAIMGAQSAHLGAGIGSRIESGDRFSVASGQAEPRHHLRPADRFSGGTLRVVESPQVERFDSTTLERFRAAIFKRTQRGNRMGVELTSGDTFAAQGGLSVVSEMISPGDVQMTGAGAPFVLGPECQTTGGYPRIATVIAPDRDRAMQAPPGAELRFQFVTREEGLAALREHKTYITNLSPEPVVRDPHDIPDLLSYQLIGGVYRENDQ